MALKKKQPNMNMKELSAWAPTNAIVSLYHLLSQFNGFCKTFQTLHDERQSEKIAVAKLDLTFLMFFPLFFLIFNFTYWISYLTL